MGNYKFSGHETFQCRHFWLKKGYEFISKKNDFKADTAVVDLGVGKNMVSSINYWLKAFNVIDSNSNLTEFGMLLLDDEHGFDPYLEDVGSQYLLHYYLMCNSHIASIYALTFERFRKTRIAFEFTESQLLDFVMKTLQKENENISEKSIINDIRVMLKMYHSSSKRNTKSIEDDFSSLLIGLNFIEVVDGAFIDGQVLYKMNYSEQTQLNELLFYFLILERFPEQASISVEKIQSEISDKILCNREGTEEKLNMLAERDFIVYKQDAGRKEIQLKTKLKKVEVLKKYYGGI
jgi:hypothetical protein